MIWCVDDDNTIRDIEVYTLTQTGFEAKGFSDGISMLEALKTEKPELIVLDIMMPGMDGVEVLKEIRNRTDTRKIPVIMATAKGTEMDKIQGLDAGADDYLTKPFAMGVRVEHSQELINASQYNDKTIAHLLPAASYSLVHNVNNRGVFSFCMCPGGMIIPASTEKGSLVVNGMSSSNRGSKFANSGIVVSINPQDVKEYKDFPALSLMKFQQECEKKMYVNNQTAPAQRISDFIKNKASSNIGASSYPSGLHACNMNDFLPKIVAENLKEVRG